MIAEECKKKFIAEINNLCRVRSAWQVWADLINCMACSLANIFEINTDIREQREKEYKECISRLGSVEVPARCFGYLVSALDADPEQDFLGSIYMELNLGNHWKGQFFTPYSICEMMSSVTITPEQLKHDIGNKGYVSICDPSCGAGATLIASVNAIKKSGINYQTDAIIVGQDIDRITGMMCFIQLSVLGCSGYVVIADSLANPMVGSPLQPLPEAGQEYWYTPFYYQDIWMIRRNRRKFKKILQESKPTYTFGFIFIYDPNTSKEEHMDKSKKFTSGYEKLEDEKKACLDKINADYRQMVEPQYNLLFGALLEECKSNPEFDKKVLDPDKTWGACMKYLMQEAMKLSNPTDEQLRRARQGEAPIGVPVSEELVIKWAKDFYNLDKVEPDKKEKNVPKKGENVPKKEKIVPEKKKAVNNTKKKTDSELGGQISIFDLL